jgi:chromosome segregation ATPase
MPKKGPSLPEQLVARNREILELKEKIRGLEQQIKDLDDTQLKKERDAARKELNDAKLLDATTLEKDLEETKKQLEKAKQDYDNLNGMNTKNVATNRGLNEQILKKDKEMRELNATLTLKSAELQAAQNKASALEEDKNKLEKEKNELKANGEDTSTAQQQVLALVEKIAQNELKIAALESKEENGATKEAIDKIQQQFKVDLQKHREQNETDKNTIAALQQTIEEHKASISEALAREGQYKIEKAQDQIIIQAHEATITEDQRKYGELVAQSSTDNGKFNARIKDLEQTIVDNKKALEDNATKIQGLQTESQDQQKTIQTCNATITEKQTKIDEQESTITANKKTIETHEKQIAGDQEALGLVTVELLQAQKEYKIATETLQKVEGQKKHYIDEYTAKSAELATMTDLKEKLQAQIAAVPTGNTTKVLQDQLDDLFHKKGEVDKKYALLEVEKDDLKMTIDKLTAEINSLQTQLTNSSTSSHVQGPSVNVKILTEQERQDELKKVHATLMETLLKQLMEKVDFPVKK